MKYFIFIIFLSLVGCAKEKIVYVDVYRTLPDSHFQKCPILAPPDRKEYKQSTDRERIKMWTNLYIKQVGLTEIRNKKLQQSLEANKLLLDAK